MAKKIELNAQLIKSFASKRKKHAPRFIESRILVVCEGEKTEPNYFKALKGSDNGVFVVNLETAGGGINTIQVVDEAIRLKDKANMAQQPYDAVWVVFDRDSFSASKFNSAITKADSHDIQCAWSNEAFELWYLLHFEYRNTPMSRKEYSDAIEHHINNSPLYKKKGRYRYVKNSSEHYYEMKTYGNIETAIKNAERLESLYSDTRYANHNPRTRVHKLLCQLLGKDKEFNKKIISKL